MAETRTRDHLANERTFLAWVRTALGLIGLGFVLARMGLFLRELSAAQAAAAASRAGASPLSLPTHLGHEFLVGGVVFLLLGTALCGWSGWLYQRNRRAIDADAYVPAAGAVWGLTAVVTLGGATIIGLAVWRTATAGH